MFEFLKRWFQSSQTDNDTAAAESAATGTAPGTHIHYDPHLVSHLIEDHRRLEGLFGRIVAASQARNAELLTKNLSDFGNAIRDHLLTENVRFYVYVQHTGDAAHADVVHGFQHEMRGIGKALTSFLFRHSEREQWNDEAWSEFARELDAIAQVLTRRIATEETTLYPLYQPPI
ncbi:MAG: hemerythrin domain-containing protein [Pseudomonadota bacterium]|nr:hemerythrin domain-containing protein [Pseudomonadota bacterium]MDP1573014.1 hemerythrin domain-containing protein [Pseudomonadota bacterium]MDP1903172.1 hemerythrin domain-containing protein [Pseudomonadota bacterium]